MLNLTEDNARDAALKLTRQIHELCGKFREVAGERDTESIEFIDSALQAARKRRLEVYAWYENHFGEEVFEELIDDCDLYFNDLTGIKR